MIKGTVIDFIRSLINSKINILSGKICDIFYDPRFNYPDTMHSDIVDDPGLYYQKILYDFDVCIHGDDGKRICDSSDINEDVINGDYEYYLLDIDDICNCHVIFMSPSHVMAFPVRLIIFTSDYQYYLSSDNKEIEAYPVNKSFLAVLDKDNPFRMDGVKEYLYNTDRPLISEKMLERYAKDLDEGNIW